MQQHDDEAGIRRRSPERGGAGRPRRTPAAGAASIYVLAYAQARRQARRWFFALLRPGCLLAPRLASYRRLLFFFWLLPPVLADFFA